MVERGHKDVVARILHEGPDGTVICRPADARLPFDIMADVQALDRRPEEYETDPRYHGGQNIRRRPDAVVVGCGNGYAGAGKRRASGTLTKLNQRIPMEFPDNVLAEADRAASLPMSTDGLEDLRDACLVTIAGEDARDFDDAIGVRREGSRWRLLVAIADVSYYVRPRTALDREARERGNSYYFPTSVEPMLPEALCNGVCSLRPHENRRCMAVDMTLDNDGNLVQSRFINGLMCSSARLTYTTVPALLDAPDGPKLRLEGQAPGVPAMLAEAAELARTLIERRPAKAAWILIFRKPPLW